MFNILLDELPTEWNGYKIDTDFQTGVMMSQCFLDDSLAEYEKFNTCVHLLFVDEHPDNTGCKQAIEWFMTEFNHDNVVGGKNDGIQVIDFDMDQWRIYSAFLNQYKIDLNTTKLHWFVFMGLLQNIVECSLTKIMEIRGKKISSKMSKDEQNYWKDMKKYYAIKKNTSQQIQSLEEQKALNEFLKYAKVGDTQS